MLLSYLYVSLLNQITVILYLFENFTQNAGPKKGQLLFDYTQLFFSSLIYSSYSRIMTDIALQIFLRDGLLAMNQILYSLFVHTICIPLLIASSLQGLFLRIGRIAGTYACHHELFVIFCSSFILYVLEYLSYGIPYLSRVHRYYIN